MPEIIIYAKVYLQDRVVRHSGNSYKAMTRPQDNTTLKPTVNFNVRQYKFELGENRPEQPSSRALHREFLTSFTQMMNQQLPNNTWQLAFNVESKVMTKSTSYRWTLLVDHRNSRGIEKYVDPVIARMKLMVSSGIVPVSWTSQDETIPKSIQYVSSDKSIDIQNTPRLSNEVLFLIFKEVDDFGTFCFGLCMYQRLLKNGIHVSDLGRHVGTVLFFK
ncbi:hypothetical protein BDC45DRAFT_541276 [Circinella umbellata]|nr:hypothetical protein BDC45DRAFT_541276 [Circinella umbellata]